ncbi:MAG: hypothetical protein AB7V58_01705 [Solirubrobacterales bacterium]
MIGRKSVIGIATLSALAVCAISAPSAMAYQTAVTCSSGAASKTFTDAHCTTAGGLGTYGHATISAGEIIEIGGSNESTASETFAAAPSRLKGALSGVATEIECTGVTGIGILRNVQPAVLMFVEGAGELHYTGCSVTKPAGKGCEVKEGEVNTEVLYATTDSQLSGFLKVEPGSTAKENKLAFITIEGCSIFALNNTFPVGGHLLASVNGATATTTHSGITSQETLTFGGVKAGLEGAFTTTAVNGGQGIALT